MCGIVGFTNLKGDVLSLIESLSKLEYRGYDSAGICYLNDNKFNVVKSVGNISKLREKIENKTTKIAIAHTRWATTGVVNEINCHPHYSCDGSVFVIHNGVIENYKEIKEKYFETDCFYSQTDTEIIPNLIQYFLKTNSMLDAIKETLILLKGSFSFLVLSNTNKENIYFAKNKTPLLIGVGDNYKIIASDILAFDKNIDKYMRLNDYSYGYISSTHLCVKSLVNVQIEEFTNFNYIEQSVAKGDFEHFMIKEILEQRQVTKRVKDYYCNLDITEIKKMISKSSKVLLVGAGTSYYAALYAKHILKEVLNINAEAYLASEFAYYPPFIDKDDVFFLFSQSGETADLIECVKLINTFENKTILFTNNIHSTLSSLSDITLDIKALNEISVASTKAYLAMVLSVYLLVCRLKGVKSNLNQFESSLSLLLEGKEKIKEIAYKYSNYEKIYYLGRGLDFYATLEGALKLKEISYINCSAYPSGELKHGTLSLVSLDTLIISLITQNKTKNLALSNVCEAISRNATEIIITPEEVMGFNSYIIEDAGELLNPLLGVVWFQLFAYYVAYSKKLDIDKPRNLAKSVTVE